MCVPSSDSLDRRLQHRADPSRAAHHDAIFALARASEMHDEETGVHLLRMRLIVEQIALHLGLDAADAEALGFDAMLHDVGKLNIPRAILQKPGQLTAEERRIMESHTVAGERLLSPRPSMERAARIARSHHECWDGSGYPDGLAGENIPLEARITTAADILDALIAQRCYKQSWGYEDAFREVVSLSGTKIDPHVIEALRKCNADGSLCAIFGLPVKCVHSAR